MTLSVRVEKADTTSYAAVVQVWQKGAPGEPDVLLQEQKLVCAAQLVEHTLWAGKYLVIKEGL